MKRLRFASGGAMAGALIGIFISSKALPLRESAPLPEFVDWFRPLVTVLIGIAGGAIGALAGLFVEAFTDQRDK